MKHVISVDINEFDSIFNQYNHNLLSYDFGKYLYNSVTTIKNTNKITIEITSKIDLSNEEQKKIKETIVKNTEFYLKKEKNLKKQDNYNKIFLMIIGITLILLANLIKEIYLIEELLLISGWVAIWEVVNDLLFVDSKRSKKIKYLKKLYKSNIEFINKV